MIESALDAARGRKKSLEEQIYRMTEGGWTTDERYESDETHKEYAERLKRELVETEREIESLTA